ncbi:MAG: CDP-diacylglycerol--serine O-phosphatidyltransferase [Bacteroidales bacterium]|nr:CDP-diacylglycerol--serine O-phosphatidyltransferase [Bacteroidales bacterium]
MANAITKHIPNTITCLNLLSGTFAIIFAYEGNFLIASALIILGAVFDFFDGMSARLLKAYSPMGKEMDSLADMVTFGVAPAMMVFSIMKTLVPDDYSLSLQQVLPYSAFLLVPFSALRLAKFNIDERQTSSFIGLPTPANALFWIGLCIGLANGTTSSLLGNFWIIFGLVIVFSYLLIAEIPMFSLKFKNLNFGENKLRYIFIIIAISILALLKTDGISAVIGVYIILSLITQREK